MPAFKDLLVIRVEHADASEETLVRLVVSHVNSDLLDLLGRRQWVSSKIHSLFYLVLTLFLVPCLKVEESRANRCSLNSHYLIADRHLARFRPLPRLFCHLDWPVSPSFSESMINLLECLAKFRLRLLLTVLEYLFISLGLVLNLSELFLQTVNNTLLLVA